MHQPLDVALWIVETLNEFRVEYVKYACEKMGFFETYTEYSPEVMALLALKKDSTGKAKSGSTSGATMKEPSKSTSGSGSNTSSKVGSFSDGNKDRLKPSSAPKPSESSSALRPPPSFVDLPRRGNTTYLQYYPTQSHALILEVSSYDLFLAVKLFEVHRPKAILNMLLANNILVSPSTVASPDPMAATAAHAGKSAVAICVSLCLFVFFSRSYFLKPHEQKGTQQPRGKDQSPFANWRKSLP